MTTLPNGLTVMLVESHKLPVVAANLVVLSGSEMNPINKPGLASFTADMLDEGTQNRSALQIADDVDLWAGQRRLRRIRRPQPHAGAAGKHQHGPGREQRRAAHPKEGRQRAFPGGGSYITVAAVHRFGLIG